MKWNRYVSLIWMFIFSLGVSSLLEAGPFLRLKGRSLRRRPHNPACCVLNGGAHGGFTPTNGRMSSQRPIGSRRLWKNWQKKPRVIPLLSRTESKTKFQGKKDMWTTVLHELDQAVIKMAHLPATGDVYLYLSADSLPRLSESSWQSELSGFFKGNSGSERAITNIRRVHVFVLSNQNSGPLINHSVTHELIPGFLRSQGFRTTSMEVFRPYMTESMPQPPVQLTGPSANQIYWFTMRYYVQPTTSLKDALRAQQRALKDNKNRGEF